MFDHFITLFMKGLRKKTYRNTQAHTRTYTKKLSTKLTVAYILEYIENHITADAITMLDVHWKKKNPISIKKTSFEDQKDFS